jgi:hypothetical protein
MSQDERVLFTVGMVNRYARVRAKLKQAPVEVTRIEAVRQLASLANEQAKHDPDAPLWALEDESGELAGGVWIRADLARHWARLRGLVLFGEEERAERGQEALAAIEAHLRALGIERVELRVRVPAGAPRSLAQWMSAETWQALVDGATNGAGSDSMPVGE